MHHFHRSLALHPEAKVNPLLPVSEPVNVMQALGAGEEVGAHPPTPEWDRSLKRVDVLKGHREMGI